MFKFLIFFHSNFLSISIKNTYKSIRFNNLVHYNKLKSDSYSYVVINGELFLYGYINQKQHDEILILAKKFFKNINDFTIISNQEFNEKLFKNKLAKEIKKDYFIYKELDKYNVFVVGKILYIFGETEDEYEKKYIKNLEEEIKNSYEQIAKVCIHILVC